MRTRHTGLASDLAKTCLNSKLAAGPVRLPPVAGVDEVKVDDLEVNDFPPTGTPSYAYE